jgi:hypothetical protein
VRDSSKRRERTGTEEREEREERKREREKERKREREREDTPFEQQAEPKGFHASLCKPRFPSLSCLGLYRPHIRQREQKWHREEQAKASYMLSHGKILE